MIYNAVWCETETVVKLRKMAFLTRNGCPASQTVCEEHYLAQMQSYESRSQFAILPDQLRLCQF